MAILSMFAFRLIRQLILVGCFAHWLTDRAFLKGLVVSDNGGRTFCCWNIRLAAGKFASIHIKWNIYYHTLEITCIRTSIFCRSWSSSIRVDLSLYLYDEGWLWGLGLRTGQHSSQVVFVADIRLRKVNCGGSSA